MSQAAETPMQLTTSTDVNVAINQALKSGNLAETLRFLLAVGTSPERLKQAFGSISHDASILCAVEIADGKKFLNEYERLDPEQRAEMDAETRAWIAAGKFKARHKDEEPAEGNEHAAKLGSALAGAHTFEEKVHAFDQHFAGGGAIWETAEAMGLSREQAEKVKGREKELSDEWDRKHQGEREKVAEELQRKGIAKSKEEADRMAKEREDAMRTKDNFLRMEREGMFNGADPERLAANRKAIEDRANKYDRDMTAAIATAPAPWAVKAEVEELSKAAASGTLTHAQELAMKAAEATHTKGGLDRLKDDKELEKFAIKATIKTDGSALGKELGAAAAATGAISEKRIGEAKFDEQAGAKAKLDATLADEFASLGEPAKVASVDIKGKLATMRNAEAPAPASKGPALA
ncbi:MAG: hypothetical protein WBH99_13170 [Azovibrio sp.]|uniref:hypothetical protein n=1 Tax=Azovibrio sp. TaxID=1872673 RepID=UPI003C75F523